MIKKIEGKRNKRNREREREGDKICLKNFPEGQSIWFKGMLRRMQAHIQIVILHNRVYFCLASY